jgi:hypothetical protein
MTAIESQFPMSSTSLATLSASSLLRAFTTMPEYVLDFAKANAIALPMPLLEPVTTATFPVRLVLFCLGDDASLFPLSVHSCGLLKQRQMQWH